MSHNENTPVKESKVQVRKEAGWTDSIDFDPIMLAVDHGGMADVFANEVIAVTTAICGLYNEQDYRLVWSDSLRRVFGVCPSCDTEFPVDEGGAGDELNEGFIAVWCGC